MTTQNYARLGTSGELLNRVLETWRAPDDMPNLSPNMIFVPDIAAQFVACPTEVERDWTYDPAAHTYSAPPAPQEP